MKSNYEERRQRRIERANELSVKNEREAETLYASAKKMAAVIPFGQPILVGHHSERRDRNYRAKIENTFRKSIEKDDKAAYYADKAEIIAQNSAISSDDPKALLKLREKLSSLEGSHAFMRAANPLLKKGDKARFLALNGANENLWRELTTPNVMGHIGFAHYSFSKSSAEIRRVKLRIAHLEKLEASETKEITIKGVRLVENVEANRLQLFFTAIPEEHVRKELKSSGFRWCRSEGAWQRQLTGNARYAAKYFLKKLE